MLEAISYFNPWADKDTLYGLEKIDRRQTITAVAITAIQSVVIVCLATYVGFAALGVVSLSVAGLFAFATFRWLIERAVASLPLPPPERTANGIVWSAVTPPGAKPFSISAFFNESAQYLFGYVEAGNDKLTMQMLMDAVIEKFKTSHGLNDKGKEFRLSHADAPLCLEKTYLDTYDATRGGFFIRLMIVDKKSE